MNDIARLRGLITGAKITFTGERGDFFRLVRRGALLELVTAGFYRFWLSTDIRRSLWANTSIDATLWNIPALPKSSCSGFCSRSQFWCRSTSSIS
jgi:Bacterial protein of unknown function (DUF898)